MNKLIVGRMKQGKTTLAMYLARERGLATVAWDPRNMIEGDVYCYSIEDLQDAIEMVKAGELPDDVTIVYRFNAANLKDEFTNFCAAIIELDNYSVVVDEASDLQGPNWMHPGFQRLTKQHKRGVDVFQTTHSLKEFNSRMRDNVTDIYCFALMGGSLKSVIDYTEAGVREENMIRELESKPYYYAHWTHETNEWEICPPISNGVRLQHKPLTESIQ